MSQLDLLNLARSCAQTIGGDFGQVITITFAMVIAIYYFLHRAGIRMKIFAFALYTCGMLVYLGMMLSESLVEEGAIKAIEAVPRNAQTLPTQFFIAIQASWVATLKEVLFNGVFWVLWLGVFYLLFLWRRPSAEQLQVPPAPH